MPIRILEHSGRVQTPHPELPDWSEAMRGIRDMLPLKTITEIYISNWCVLQECRSRSGKEQRSRASDFPRRGWTGDASAAQNASLTKIALAIRAIGFGLQRSRQAGRPAVFARGRSKWSDKSGQRCKSARQLDDRKSTRLNSSHSS